ncbi:protein NYNRIN-like [Bactrocera neohumeralis]|uniref:protein NYNRIN-like n=1 Tax=Bactrocera neohumeralis TaxID=98809 RepID=UPI00216619BC|nr:protein NYNRIN-like [Bactrocera neohumeralis]
MDIVGPLPPCKGYRYCLTIVDRYSRWLEALPLEDMTTETIAFNFYTHWIARFGVPSRVTTDQGRQFESTLFRELSRLLGIKHLRTTAYHPASNGIIERWHRSLKAAIKCYMTDNWVEVFPLILQGFRSSWRNDLKATPAEMVYGNILRLPAQFFAEKHTHNEGEFVENLRKRMQSLKPSPTTNNSAHVPFIEKNLHSTPSVFVRNDSIRPPLQPP